MEKISNLQLLSKDIASFKTLLAKSQIQGHVHQRKLLLKTCNICLMHGIGL